MPNWRTINTAPKGKCVLATDGKTWFEAMYEYDRWYAVNNGDYTDGGYGNNWELPSEHKGIGVPTHWMDLSKLPKTLQP